MMTETRAEFKDFDDASIEAAIQDSADPVALEQFWIGLTEANPNAAKILLSFSRDQSPERVLAAMCMVIIRLRTPQPQSPEEFLASLQSPDSPPAA